MKWQPKIVTYEMVNKNTVPFMRTGEPYLFDLRTYPGRGKECLRWELCRKGAGIVTARIRLKADAVKFARLLHDETERRKCK